MAGSQAGQGIAALTSSPTLMAETTGVVLFQGAGLDMGVRLCLGSPHSGMRGALLGASLKDCPGLLRPSSPLGYGGSSRETAVQCLLLKT